MNEASPYYIARSLVEDLEYGGCGLLQAFAAAMQPYIKRFESLALKRGAGILRAAFMRLPCGGMQACVMDEMRRTKLAYQGKTQLCIVDRNVGFHV